MAQAGAAGQDLDAERGEIFQILERRRALAGNARAAVVEQEGRRQLFLLGEREQEALEQDAAQLVVALAHVVGRNDNDGLFLRGRYGAGNFLVSALRDRALGRDGHAELLFAALFGPDGAALALCKARQILHRDLVVHECLYRAGAVQLLQRVQCFYDRDRACLAHRIYLNHQTSSFGIFCCYYSTTVRPFSIVLHIAQETAGKRRFSVLREIRRKKRLRFRVFAV